MRFPNSLTFGLAIATAVVIASHSARADTIKIGMPPFYNCALGYVAQERGFWKESGLHVEIKDFQGGPQVNEALLAGAINFGMGVGIAPAIALASRNARIVVIAAETYSDATPPQPDELVVPGNSPITSIKQLNGKPIAVHAKGTISDILLRAISSAEGIKPIVVEIPAPDQWAALTHGDVLAAMAETPFPEQMKMEGARYLYGIPNKKVVPYLLATVTLTSRDFAKKHPNEVRKVVDVILRTSRWIMVHREEAKHIIAARLRYPPTVVHAINANSYKWIENGNFLMPSVYWWGREMKQLGIIQNQPDYAKYFVTTYIKAAEKDVGKVPDPDFDRALKQPFPQR